MISRVPNRRWEMVSEHLVVGYDPAGVADHVRVALLETEHPVDVDPGIHACDHRHTLCRGDR